MVTFYVRLLVIYQLFLGITFTLHANLTTFQQLPATFHIDVTTEYKNSTLVSALSGLGAKLPLAQRMHQHAALGFDLVAHCINELIAHHAQPLFFSTYFATSSLQNTHIINGIIAGCTQSKCPFMGSETEEIKKLFAQDDYDIGGFAIGIADRNSAVKEPITCGDVIIGLPTSGIHASSFSTIQSLIDYYDMDITVHAPFITFHPSLAHTILEPITLYTHAILSPCKHPHIKAITHVAHGGLYTALTHTIPAHLQAKIELYRWPIPPVLRWIKQIGKLDAHQMTQKFNLGIGMLFIVHPFYAKKIIMALRHKKINAVPIGIIEQRSADAAPVTLVGTIGSTHSRVLIIGDSMQDHAFAWKLAQSPYIERIFIAPGNGGTATEHKVQNLSINPTHHGALIAYIQQNNIDMVIVTKEELLTHGIINEFSKAGIACLGAPKKAIRLAKSPEFIQRYTIPTATSTTQGTAVQYAVITDGITTIPFTSCQQYKKQYDNDMGPTTDGMGTCCPAPSMSQKIDDRIMNEIIKPCLDGFKAEGISLCGFLAVDLIITPHGDPSVVQFHFDLGTCTAPAILLRLQTDFFKLCYATCHQQLNVVPLQWDTQSALSVMLLHTNKQQEMMIGLPEATINSKVVHMHSLYKDGKYSTNGTQPLCVTALGETLEKARNNTYKLAQQIYWPGIEYRHDIAYREITRHH